MSTLADYQHVVYERSVSNIFLHLLTNLEINLSRNCPESFIQRSGLTSTLNFLRDFCFCAHGSQLRFRYGVRGAKAY
jgi:hypothetical protein